MKALWEWLDGNKTMFGNGILAIAAHVPPEVTIPYIEVPLNVILYTIGSSLTGVGVVDKVRKRRKTSP